MQMGDEGCGKKEDVDPWGTSVSKEPPGTGRNMVASKGSGSPLIPQGQKKPLQRHTCSWAGTHTEGARKNKWEDRINCARKQR